MAVRRVWCVIFVVVVACTCGARTECGKSAQISFLTSMHDDPSCTKLSKKGVMLYEAAKLLAEIRNNKTDDGFDIGINVFDTCGGTIGALKAVMKALVRADIDCLHPPYYLGIIGPDSVTNVEAIHKVTSILEVPHIIKKQSISPYLHLLAEESNSYVVQGILKMIETLKWKSFTLVTNVDSEANNEMQNIAKKLMINAIEKNLCVILRNDKKDYASRFVHIGKPEERFLTEFTNATILIISQGNLKDYLNRINSSNTVLLLEDSRNAIDGLEQRVKNSQWWTFENGLGKYDTEVSGQIRWLENAIKVYAKALKALCGNKKCRNRMNSSDWNRAVSSTLTAQNIGFRTAPRSLDLSIKSRTGKPLERLGGMIVFENKSRVYWSKNKSQVEKEEGDGEENAEDHGAATIGRNEQDMPPAFSELLAQGSPGDEPRTRCATITEETKMLHDKTKRILVSGIDDSEWWTMVCTVSGVGIAMFLVGTFAVYVIYANIRPRYPKSKDHSDKTGSPRRMSSELPATTTINRNQRPLPLQRTNSDRSYMSERSV